MHPTALHSLPRGVCHRPLLHTHRQQHAGGGILRRPGMTQAAVAESPPQEDATDTGYSWTGSDGFSDLEDRQAVPPLPPPPVKQPKRVVLVRHGQSTWNAEGIIQGSSDVSMLTPTGISQAETTRQNLRGDRFDALFQSPLKRASDTADIVWNGRPGPVVTLPCLREIDLYSFQGLRKAEGKDTYGEEYIAWQKRAAEFTIDGQAPVRELWYRASLAWQEILGPDGPGGDSSCALIVAHNAVNQALLCTALGLPPTRFRRLTQSNAATSVLDFTPGPKGPTGPPRVILDRLNQTPGPPFGGAAKPGVARLLLVRVGQTASGAAGHVVGASNEPPSELGAAQNARTADLLTATQVDVVASSPLVRSVAAAEAIIGARDPSGAAKRDGRLPSAFILPFLADRNFGSLQGQMASPGRPVVAGDGAESLADFHSRVGIGYHQMCDLAQRDGGRTVAVCTHSTVIASLLCHCLGLPATELNLFRTSPGSVSVLEFPWGPAQGNLRCTNFTAHLGEWAVPVTPVDADDEELRACGIEGCF